jgi:hypothetical protein
MYPKRRGAPSRRRGPVRVGTPAFDPLAELIKEFTPQHTTQRRVRRSPNLAKPTRFSDDPYAISKDPYGPRNSLPTNRRNPRRKQARSNPDAKAAMELHHNTGMSLKQAWKCVKRGDTPYDFGSQYEYRRGAYTAADASPPVNRRNPRRRNAPMSLSEAQKTRVFSKAHFEVMFFHPDDGSTGMVEFVAPASGLGGDTMKIRRMAAARAIADHVGGSFDDAMNSILQIRIKLKGGSKSKKKSRKKARSNPDAAAAMNLHHSTGISLKQAWNQVRNNPGAQRFYRMHDPSGRGQSAAVRKHETDALARLKQLGLRDAGTRKAAGRAIFRLGMGELDMFPLEAVKHFTKMPAGLKKRKYSSLTPEEKLATAFMYNRERHYGNKRSVDSIVETLTELRDHNGAEFVESMYEF